jgi:hypothetical protein
MVGPTKGGENPLHLCNPARCTARRHGAGISERVCMHAYSSFCARLAGCCEVTWPAACNACLHYLVPFIRFVGFSATLSLSIFPLAVGSLRAFASNFFLKKKTETLSLREERRLGLHSLYPGHNTRKRNKRGWRSSLRSQAAQPALQPDQQNKKRREQSSRSLRPQEKKTKCPY